MNTPMYGKTITRTSQPVLPQPPMSWRRKTSLKTVIRSQNQITHAKKTRNDHITSPNE